MAKTVFKARQPGLSTTDALVAAPTGRVYFRVDGRLPERIEDRMLPQLNGCVDRYLETNYGLTRPEKFGEAGWFNDRYAPELAKVSRRIALVGMCATEGDAKNITEADVQAWHDKKVTELTPGVTVSEAAAKEPTKPTKPPLAGFDTTASGDHRPGLWRQTEGA